MATGKASIVVMIHYYWQAILGKKEQLKAEQGKSAAAVMQVTPSKLSGQHG